MSALPALQETCSGVTSFPTLQASGNLLSLSSSHLCPTKSTQTKIQTCSGNLKKELRCIGVWKEDSRLKGFPGCNAMPAMLFQLPYVSSPDALVTLGFPFLCKAGTVSWLDLSHPLQLSPSLNHSLWTVFFLKSDLVPRHRCSPTMLYLLCPLPACWPTCLLTGGHFADVTACFGPQVACIKNIQAALRKPCSTWVIESCRGNVRMLGSQRTLVKGVCHTEWHQAGLQGHCHHDVKARV